MRWTQPSGAGNPGGQRELPHVKIGKKRTRTNSGRWASGYANSAPGDVHGRFLPDARIEGRAMGGAITALMCGGSVPQSREDWDEDCGAHGAVSPGYAENREPMLDVIRMHREACAGGGSSGST